MPNDPRVRICELAQEVLRRRIAWLRLSCLDAANLGLGEACACYASAMQRARHDLAGVVERLGKLERGEL